MSVRILARAFSSVARYLVGAGAARPGAVRRRRNTRQYAGSSQRAIKKRSVASRLARAGLLVPLLAAVTALAQPYPSKLIKLIVPVAAGGQTDVMARAFAQRLAGPLGQTVIVENRPGAHAAIGAEFVAKSPPDGHTLLFSAASTIVINPFLYANLPYDPVRDFVPVAMCCSQAMAVIVNPVLGVNSLRDLVTLARTKPGALSYGSMGSGSTGHLYMEMFKQQAGIDVLHVPYKGSSPAVLDLVGGQISIMVLTPGTVPGQLRSGKLRALAIGSTQRSVAFPELPTSAEAGFAGFQALEWFGLFAPTGTPRETIARLNTEMTRILGSKEFHEEWLNKNGFETPASNTPEQFAAFIQAEMQRFRPLVKSTGAKAD